MMGSSPSFLQFVNQSNAMTKKEKYFKERLKQAQDEGLTRKANHYRNKLDKLAKVQPKSVGVCIYSTEELIKKAVDVFKYPDKYVKDKKAFILHHLDKLGLSKSDALDIYNQAFDQAH